MNLNKTRIRLLILAAALPASAALAATVTVMVQETVLRKRAQFFAPSAGQARLGESFEASGPQGGWYKVSGGWLHQSAVTTKKLKLGSGGSVGGSASAEEVTLAGKGFNSSVESSYRSQNPAADFRGVDAMERRSFGDADIREFLRSGGLLSEEGAP